jgi:hypothetical protein
MENVDGHSSLAAGLPDQGSDLGQQPGKSGGRTEG